MDYATKSLNDYLDRLDYLDREDMAINEEEESLLKAAKDLLKRLPSNQREVVETAISEAAVVIVQQREPVKATSHWKRRRIC